MRGLNHDETLRRAEQLTDISWLAFWLLTVALLSLAGCACSTLWWFR